MISFNEAAYIKLLGQMESDDNYSIENNIGALGRYQFMPATLNNLELIYSLPSWKNKTYFLSNPSLQDLYIKYLILDTKNFISRNGLEKYYGTPVSGSFNKRFKNITAPLNIYGMLAASHLSGPTALKNFLLFGTNPDDGSTSLSDYAAYFSNKLNASLNYLPLLLAFIPAIILYYYK